MAAIQAFMDSVVVIPSIDLMRMEGSENRL